MSTGMLGKLPLSAVRGPRDTLEQCLAGESGEHWLKALNKFLRGENPWPIVSRIVDRCYKITVGDGITATDLVQGACCDISQNAWSVIKSAQFVMDEDKAEYDIVMLEFDNINIGEVELRSQHVLAEMRRLEYEPPSFEDAFRFITQYPVELRFRTIHEIIFLHQAVRIFPAIGPDGVAIGTSEDGKIPAVLTLRNSPLSGNTIITANESLLVGRRFAARRFRW